MANIEIDRFDVKPRIVAANQRGVQLQRTHNMLVGSAIGAMMIVVIAALFMTMF
ncbi:MAG TPA: hypothetical protein PK286_02250 [Devosia sp.]|nr:hypothetical protein [Devosia sp.]